MSLLAELDLGSASVTLRRARVADVRDIVGLLADDPLGGGRDGVRTAADLRVYERAFALIDGDPAHLLVVAEAGAAVVGTMQLLFLPGLSRRGALRAQVEAVRVAAELRGNGLGSAMIRWAISEARRRGCALIQLTSDNSRADAHRFYARLGFVNSHAGMKLSL